MAASGVQSHAGQNSGIDVEKFRRDSKASNIAGSSRAASDQQRSASSASMDISASSKSCGKELPLSCNSEGCAMHSHVWNGEGYDHGTHSSAGCSIAGAEDSGWGSPISKTSAVGDEIAPSFYLSRNDRGGWAAVKSHGDAWGRSQRIANSPGLKATLTAIDERGATPQLNSHLGHGSSLQGSIAAIENNNWGKSACKSSAVGGGCDRSFYSQPTYSSRCGPPSSAGGNAWRRSQIYVNSPVSQVSRPGGRYDWAATPPASNQSAKPPVREYERLTDIEGRMYGVDEQIQGLSNRTQTQEYHLRNLAEWCAGHVHHTVPPNAPAQHYTYINTPKVQLPGSDTAAYTGRAAEVGLLRRCVENASLSADDRYKALGILSTLEANREPPQTAFQAHAAQPSMETTGPQPANKVQSTSISNGGLNLIDHHVMILMNMSKDITKIKAFNKLQHMQQDTDRLARIEAQLSKSESDPQSRHNITTSENARPLDSRYATSASVSECNRYARDGFIALGSQFRALSDRLMNLENAVYDNAAISTNQVARLDARFADIETRVGDVESNQDQQRYAGRPHRYAYEDSVSGTSGSGWGGWD